MSESKPDDILSWENLVYLADFLQAAQERQFRLLGGEPTLHPDFTEMTAYLLERGFEVVVFTSGVMPEGALEKAVAALGHVSGDKLSFLCNLNDPVKTKAPKAEADAVHRFLEAFGPRITAGFNIYRNDFELDFLFQLITQYGLRRHLRLGLTHPIAGEKNLHIKTGDVEHIINRVFSYRPEFERLKVRPGLDCGFPMCRFTDEQLAWMYRHSGGRYDFGCAPVVDIGPDMTVWSCFPLSAFHKRSLFDFDTFADVRNYYDGLHKQVRVEAGGVFGACDTCESRDDRLCGGGCLSHSVAQFQHEERVRMPDVYL
jgi:MoaA/NifB/PqqE/SkfB family radical SAM enzyme